MREFNDNNEHPEDEEAISSAETYAEGMESELFIEAIENMQEPLTDELEVSESDPELELDTDPEAEDLLQNSDNQFENELQQPEISNKTPDDEPELFIDSIELLEEPANESAEESGLNETFEYEYTEIEVEDSDLSHEEFDVSDEAALVQEHSEVDIESYDESELEQTEEHSLREPAETESAVEKVNESESLHDNEVTDSEADQDSQPQIPADEQIAPTEQSTESDASNSDQQAPEQKVEDALAAEVAQEEVNTEDLEYMSDTSAAMLMKTPRGGRLLIYIMMLAIITALVWASMSPLDEITRGMGNVIPSSRLQVIQNLEGGILETLYVQEGELVREGQPLLQLDDTRFTSSFRESAVEYYSELARAARLKAELSGKLLKFPPELDEYQDYVNREVLVFEKRTNSLKAELDIANTQASQAKHELAASEAQLEYLITSLELGQEELDLTAPLARQGLVSQVEMLQLRQRVNELGSDKRMTELSIPKLEAAYQEALARKRELREKFREEVAEELKETETRLDQLTETQTNLKDQVTRTLVRSPVEGIVKKINLTTIGGVIQPGMDLMEIVPVEDTLLVEAQISPKDIGFLHEGMPTIVKLTAYDFAIYGGMEGTLEHISADTIKDEKGESFYIVRIRTNKSHLGTAENPLEIIPGMKTNVDIITGKKTLLEYLLKPILRARENALTER